MTLTRRDAGAADLGTLGQFIYQLWHAHDAAEDLTVDLATMRAAEMAEHYRMHLWERDGEAVAYAATQDNGDHVFIRHFVVSDAVRGQGIGRSVVELLVTECFPGRKFRLEASKTHTAPKAFWEAMGFRARAYSMERDAA